MKPFAELMLHLKQHPDWEGFQEMLLKERPTIPLFDPKIDNSELWRSRSREKVGYDKALFYLDIKPEN